jgi:hypothetical protein
MARYKLIAAAAAVSFVAFEIGQALAQAPAAKSPPPADAARDACLIEKYTAHRNISREFQRKRIAVLAVAGPEAKAALDAQLEQQLAANDRLEIAFRHFLATDRKKLSFVPETNSWLILADTDDQALQKLLPDYAAAKAREIKALEAMKTNANPAVGKAARAQAADPNSPLAAALKEASAAFAANDKKACP